ncbi:MAG: ribosomal protein S18 acetylase RimI-like enzyme [Arenicella sp.]|jgi:ribosomal protein S18 acetylase RimI-like enzyme
MNIRPFDIDDQAALIALWREVGLATPQNDSHKDIKRKLQVDPELLLVAIIDRAIVGSVMGGYEGHRGWINYLAVSPNFQRQGIASELMRRVESDLLLKGCAKINLQIRAINKSVLAFYVALGYLDDDVVSLGKRLIHDS